MLRTLKAITFILFAITSVNVQALSVQGEYNCKVRHVDEDLSGDGTNQDCHIVVSKKGNHFSVQLKSEIKYKDSPLLPVDKNFIYEKEDWWKGHVLKSLNKSHEANIVAYTIGRLNGMDISINFYANRKWYTQKTLELSCTQIKAVAPLELDLKM